MDLSIIIPSYNELKRLPRTLKAYISFFNKKNINYELIIADLSDDGTEDFIKKLNNKHVKYLKLRERGKGLAVIKGFRKARGKVVGFVDADNSTPPGEFYKLFKLTDKYDCVIGSRGLFREHALNYNNSLLRKLFSFMLSVIFVKGLFGLKINDSQCGAKLFRKNKLRKILPELKLTNSYFDIELLWRFSKVGSIKEEVIKWRDAAGSHFKWNELINGSISLIKLRLGL